MTFNPANSVAWTEIPVTDLDRATNFYEKVFDFQPTLNEDGPNPIVDIQISDTNGGVSGQLYPGKPAGHGSGSTIHLNVPDTLEDTAERVTQAGGAVLSGAIVIPPDAFGMRSTPMAIPSDCSSRGKPDMRRADLIGSFVPVEGEAGKPATRTFRPLASGSGARAGP